MADPAFPGASAPVANTPGTGTEDRVSLRMKRVRALVREHSDALCNAIAKELDDFCEETRREAYQRQVEGIAQMQTRVVSIIDKNFPTSAAAGPVGLAPPQTANQQPTRDTGYRRTYYRKLPVEHMAPEFVFPRTEDESVGLFPGDVREWVWTTLFTQWRGTRDPGNVVALAVLNDGRWALFRAAWSGNLDGIADHESESHPEDDGYGRPGGRCASVWAGTREELVYRMPVTLYELYLRRTHPAEPSYSPTSTPQSPEEEAVGCVE